MKKLEIIKDFNLDYLKGNIFTEGLDFRKSCTQNMEDPPEYSKIFMFSSTEDNLVFRRSNSTKRELNRVSSDTIYLTEYVPSLTSEKYNTNLLIPKNSLIIGSWITTSMIKKLSTYVVFDAVKKQCKNINMNVRGNDILINNCKFCGIEEILTPYGIWTDALINIDVFNNKDFFIKYLGEETTKTITGLQENIPNFNFLKFINSLAKNYKEFSTVKHL